MLVKRIIAISPVEPQPMSLRSPASMPLKLDILYLDSQGGTINEDIGGTLQLIARTSGSVTTYAAPATDIVNGKARVSIGSDILTDMNGYNLRLFGTVRQEPTLLAMGVLRLTAAAGQQALPPDVIDNVPITIPYSFAYAMDLKLWADTGKSVPFDMTSATVTATIEVSESDNTIVLPFTVTPVGPGHVYLQLTQPQVNSLPAVAWWSFRASNAAGVTTLCEGSVTCTGGISTL
jgi:hypothetical protein